MKKLDKTPHFWSKIRFVKCQAKAYHKLKRRFFVYCLAILEVLNSGAQKNNAKNRWFSGIESFVAEINKKGDNYVTKNVPIAGTRGDPKMFVSNEN